MKLAVRRLVFSDDLALGRDSAGEVKDGPRHIKGRELTGCELEAMAYAVGIEVFPDDDALGIYADRHRQRRPGEINLGKLAVLEQIAMEVPTAEFNPDDLPGIDGLNGREIGTWKIDLSEGPSAEDKAVEMPRAVAKKAAYLAIGADAEGHRSSCAGEVDRAPIPLAQQKPVPLVILVYVHPYYVTTGTDVAEG